MMSDNNLESQIREALEQPCGCTGYTAHHGNLYPIRVGNCPDCRSKRIAAMAETAYMTGAHTNNHRESCMDAALRALKGKP